MAAVLALSMAAAWVDLAKFSAYQVLKCLHIGEPINMYGFCSRNSFRALSRLALMLKSQGRPSSGSLTVMSNANPGMMWRIFRSRIILVTRAGE